MQFLKYSLLISLLWGVSLCYSQEEEAVELSRDGSTLKGTLTWSGEPAASEALVILIAGSGPTDRDGNNPQMKNNSLKMVSEMLVENGYACLRYDKRGIGKSDIEEEAALRISFDDFIADAKAWANKYAADARFHSITLLGHSQGSLVAICAANRTENVDAVISIAGAGQPIHEILKWQLSRSLSTQMQGIVDAKLDTLAMGDTLKEVPDFLSNIFHPSIQPFLISWMKYDPVKQAAQLKVPLLIVNGTTDLQIRPKEDAEALKSAQPQAKLVVIKHMNHILKFTKSTDIGEQLELYSDPDVPLHKKLKKPIISFLKDLE